MSLRFIKRNNFNIKIKDNERIKLMNKIYYTQKYLLSLLAIDWYHDFCKKKQVQTIKCTLKQRFFVQQLFKQVRGHGAIFLY